ncbi:MAG: metal ABC transporter permease [Muribaculaceae bacterium]|nr:metal ABC transporter permease [Muribaculaceae bacterium]
MELLKYEFFRNALIGIVIVSLISAVIGTYIVTRRMVFISGGITHACFGGLGMGYWLGVSPLATAALFAVGGALGVDWLSRRSVRKDSAIAVIWALGMALGILFIFLTSGYVPELNTFLFGNVLTITVPDLWIFGGFTAVALLLFGLMHRAVIAVSFDEDFARTRHLPVRVVNTLMTVLVAVSIVLTIRMIGIMLLMSLMSLPQMTAELYTRRYGTLLGWSALISLAGCIGGLTAAYYLGVPASAAIVLLLVLLYGLGALLRRLRGA